MTPTLSHLSDPALVRRIICLDAIADRIDLRWYESVLGTEQSRKLLRVSRRCTEEAQRAHGELRRRQRALGMATIRGMELR